VEKDDLAKLGVDYRYDRFDGIRIRRQVCCNVSSEQSPVVSITAIYDEESRGSSCFLSSYEITLVFGEWE
jgi:hypothetical protein